MKEKIKKIIAKIKPAIEAHGGEIKFVDYDEKKKVVKVSLKGACAHCPMSEMTLRAGVLFAIQEELPEVKDVENV